MSAVPILLYHSISDQPVAGQEAFTVTPTAFREHVRAIVDAGCTALTASEMATALRGDGILPPRPVLVTFDDGFADAQPAIELLLSEGLGATVFITSGEIGVAPMLTPTDIRGLAELGPRVEVGAHSVTHPRLDEIPAPQAAVEISDSKATIEAIVEAPLKSFAYPHGAYDKRVRTEVVNAGFHAATAVKNALSHNRDDSYALARVTVMASTSTQRVKMLLAGSGAPLAWRHERMRTRGYRSIRRIHRQLRRTSE